MPSDTTFKARPLIRNATHPRDLFTDEELDLIKAAVARDFAFQRYGKKATVKEEESKAAGELLALARFHGYYPDHITPDKKLKWMVMCEPSRIAAGYPAVVITIRACEDCSEQFHAHHYTDEEPPDLCDRCGRIATLKAKKTRQEDVPF